MLNDTGCFHWIFWPPDFPLVHGPFWQLTYVDINWYGAKLSTSRYIYNTDVLAPGSTVISIDIVLSTQLHAFHLFRDSSNIDDFVWCFLCHMPFYLMALQYVLTLKIQLNNFQFGSYPEAHIYIFCKFLNFQSVKQFWMIVWWIVLKHKSVSFRKNIHIHHELLI